MNVNMGVVVLDTVSTVVKWCVKSSGGCRHYVCCVRWCVDTGGVVLDILSTALDWCAKRSMGGDTMYELSNSASTGGERFRLVYRMSAWMMRCES